jgi:sialidase-1
MWKKNIVLLNLAFSFYLIINFADKSCALEQGNNTLITEQRLKTEFEARGGLNNCKKNFINKKTGRVAFIGGSITANPGWRDLVCTHIKHEFPNTQFDFINAGVGGTNSTFGAARLDDFVLSKGKIDLLFVEFAVNDYPSSWPDNSPALAMEGIVRHARSVNPEMDIMIMYFADDSKVQEIKAHKCPEIISIHDKIAKYYNIASLDLAKDIAVRLDANEFTWPQFSADTCHPTKFGGECYGQTITAALHSAWQSTGSDVNERPVSYVLGPPLDKQNYEKGRFIDINEAKLISDWTIIPKWTSEKYGGQDAVLEATTPGASLELSFEGSAIGIYEIAGMDAGTVKYDIDGKISGTTQLFDRYCVSYHRQIFRVFANNLTEGKHKLTLVIGTDHDEKSVGTAVRIVKFAAF